MNEQFLDIAKLTADTAHEAGLTNIDYRWIYSQFAHETGEFTSRLCTEDCNLGGLTTDNPTEYELANMGQPDGTMWYKHFDCYEDYARYFGKYLRGYIDGGIDTASTLEDYIHALKYSPSGAYFGDDYESYLSDCERIYQEDFNA